jgi:hypothetical protein
LNCNSQIKSNKPFFSSEKRKTKESEFVGVSETESPVPTILPFRRSSISFPLQHKKPIVQSEISLDKLPFSTMFAKELGEEIKPKSPFKTSQTEKAKGFNAISMGKSTEFLNYLCNPIATELDDTNITAEDASALKSHISNVFRKQVELLGVFYCLILNSYLRLTSFYLRTHTL